MDLNRVLRQKAQLACSATRASWCARLARIAVAISFILLLASGASAQKTDIVTLANGDRITGEIVRLERGRLEFDTDDAGTLHLEWDKLVSVVTKQLVEVLTTADLRFLGTLGPAPDRSIAVVEDQQPITLLMTEVTFISPIGATFWTRLDGAIDVGFSYTRSSDIAQLNLNSDTVYRRPAFTARLTASLTQTEQEEGDGDDRASIDLSYLSNRWRGWFVLGAGRFESNKSLGLELRSQVAGAAGPRLVNSNRAQMGVGGGLAFNDERGVDVEPTQNVEGLLIFQMSYYTYDRPKTNVDVKFQYYPGLSTWGRQRIQFDTSIRRELLKDFFAALNVFDTFDSQPPNEEADRNDVGVVVSLGWSY